MSSITGYYNNVRLNDYNYGCLTKENKINYLHHRLMDQYRYLRHYIDNRYPDQVVYDHMFEIKDTVDKICDLIN